MKSLINKMTNRYMQKLITTSLLLLFTGFSTLLAQSGGDIKMKSFIPESKAFDIYYPETFKVEDEYGVVFISDSVSGISITVTSYTKENNISQKDLTDLMSGFIKSYYAKELTALDWAVYKSKFDHLIETRFEKKGNHWIWWGVAQKNRVLFISADNKKPITEEELQLIRFMIDKLIIF